MKNLILLAVLLFSQASFAKTYILTLHGNSKVSDELPLMIENSSFFCMADIDVKRLNGKLEIITIICEYKSNRKFQVTLTNFCTTDSLDLNNTTFAMLKDGVKKTFSEIKFDCKQ